MELFGALLGVGDPGDEREGSLRGLLAAGAPVGVVSAALTADRRGALGPAVDLEEPAIFELAADRDDVEVWSDDLARAPGTDVAAPAGGFDLDAEQCQLSR